MLEALLCLLGCAALGDLRDLRVLGEGAQVQVTSADLSTFLVAGSVRHGSLDLEADLAPLTNVVLIISQPPEPPAVVQNVSDLRSSEVVSLSGFISPSGHDIMLQEPGGTISLKDWLSARHITLDLEK